jgi:hypothetical protein
MAVPDGGCRGRDGTVKTNTVPPALNPSGSLWHGLPWNRRMSNPLSRLATRVAYGASQLPRVAWYVGHSLAVRRLSEAAQRRDGKKARPRPRALLRS